MQTQTVREGDLVVVTDVDGNKHEMQAVTGVVEGREFPVVWVRRPGASIRVPFPAESVRPA